MLDCKLQERERAAAARAERAAVEKEARAAAEKEEKVRLSLLSGLRATAASTDSPLVSFQARAEAASSKARRLVWRNVELSFIL
jgi:hypothetical protein